MILEAGTHAGPRRHAGSRGASIRRLAAALLVAAVAATASAQPPPALPPGPTTLQGSVGILGGIPMGAFANNVESAGGFAGGLDLGLGSGLVSVGGEAAYLLYGSQSRKIDLGQFIPELPNTVVTLTTDNAIILVLGRVRVQRPWGRWRPYVDGLAGFGYIYTKTSIDGTDACGTYSCSSEIGATNFDDFVPSLGGGVGILWDVAKPGGTRLDFSLRYLGSGQADYLREGAIRPVYVSRSRTDMVLFHIGVNFGR